MKRSAGTPGGPCAVISLRRRVATETYFDLLPDHGISYSIDLVQDDRPVPIITRNGARLISVPYSSEINDVRIMGFRDYSADDYASMVKACFDQLYEKAARAGMSCAFRCTRLSSANRIASPRFSTSFVM